MNFFHHAVQMASWLGVAMVKMVKTNKGIEYVPSKIAIIPFILQILALPWMVIAFQNYMSLKDYYSPNRKFQVKVLMYCEVGHCLCTVVCSFWYRFPNIRKFFWRCTNVMQDLEGSKVPYLAHYTLPIFLLTHALLTIYRAKHSVSKPKLLIPFWIGTNQVIMVVAILYLALVLVDMTLQNVLRDLTYILSLRSRESSKFVKRQLILIRQRHYRGIRLFATIREDFGPDVFVLCFFFLFKLTFVCYHMYYKKDIRLWGQNSLVGELTGYFQITQLVVCATKLAYVSDKISEKMAKVDVILLNLFKDRIEEKNTDMKDLIKTLIVQNKAYPRRFSVCNHFVLNRELVYNLILGAVTYVFILIQFQGTKNPEEVS